MINVDPPQVANSDPGKGQSLPPPGSHWPNGPGAPVPRFSCHGSALKSSKNDRSHDLSTY